MMRQKSTTHGILQEPVDDLVDASSISINYVFFILQLPSRFGLGLRFHRRSTCTWPRFRTLRTSLYHREKPFGETQYLLRSRIELPPEFAIKRPVEREVRPARKTGGVGRECVEGGGGLLQECGEVVRC